MKIAGYKISPKGYAIRPRFPKPDLDPFYEIPDIPELNAAFEQRQLELAWDIMLIHAWFRCKNTSMVFITTSFFTRAGVYPSEFKRGSTAFKKFQKPREFVGDFLKELSNYLWDISTEVDDQRVVKIAAQVHQSGIAAQKSASAYMDLRVKQAAARTEKKIEERHEFEVGFVHKYNDTTNHARGRKR